MEVKKHKRTTRVWCESPATGWFSCFALKICTWAEFSDYILQNAKINCRYACSSWELTAVHLSRVASLISTHDRMSEQHQPIPALPPPLATNTQQTSFQDRFFLPSDSQPSPSAVSRAVRCLQIDTEDVAYPWSHLYWYYYSKFFMK